MKRYRCGIKECRAWVDCDGTPLDGCGAPDGFDCTTGDGKRAVGFRMTADLLLPVQSGFLSPAFVSPACPVVWTPAQRSAEAMDGRIDGIVVAEIGTLGWLRVFWSRPRFTYEAAGLVLTDCPIEALSLDLRRRSVRSRAVEWLAGRASGEPWAGSSAPTWHLENSAAWLLGNRDWRFSKDPLLGDRWSLVPGLSELADERADLQTLEDGSFAVDARALRICCETLALKPLPR